MGGLHIIDLYQSFVLLRVVDALLDQHRRWVDHLAGLDRTLVPTAQPRVRLSGGWWAVSLWSLYRRLSVPTAQPRVRLSCLGMVGGGDGEGWG